MKENKELFSEIYQVQWKVGTVKTYNFFISENQFYLRNATVTMCDVVKCKHGDKHDSSSKIIQQFRMSPSIIISKCPKLCLDI